MKKILILTLILTGCASTPMGPTVQALPSPNKPFDVFQSDQEQCKNYARSQVAGQAESANWKALGAGALGAGLGAGLGAAVGGGYGAGIGAASGAGIGTGVGAMNSSGAQGSIQEQYNNAYISCMYSKGNQVPGVALNMYQVPPNYNQR